MEIGIPQTIAGWCGLIGSLVLLAVPIRDQLSRWQLRRIEKLGEGAKTSAFGPVFEGARDRNAGWHWADSLAITVGAIFLSLSYLVTSPCAESEQLCSSDPSEQSISALH